VNYVARNADNFVVGRWMGAASLGLYNRAYNLMSLPHTYGASVMTSVLFPVFAQAQGNQERVRRGYLLLTQITAMVAGPAMATMAIVAPHLVLTVYGPKWTGVVRPLQILCMAGYFRALYHLGGVVAQSVGLVYAELRNQAIYAVMVIGGALLGSRQGLSWVAAGVSVAIVYMFVATAHLALSATGTQWREYFRVQVDALVVSAFTGAIALVVRLLLEAAGVSDASIALVALAAASVPWGLRTVWLLGKPEFESLRAGLPRPARRLVERLDPRRRAAREGGRSQP